eukprot:6211970-Pleurochrysis_carterae.AAC.1
MSSIKACPLVKSPYGRMHAAPIYFMVPAADICVASCCACVKPQAFALAPLVSGGAGLAGAHAGDGA